MAVTRVGYEILSNDSPGLSASVSIHEDAEPGDIVVAAVACDTEQLNECSVMGGWRLVRFQSIQNLTLAIVIRDIEESEAGTTSPAVVFDTQPELTISAAVILRGTSPSDSNGDLGSDELIPSDHYSSAYSIYGPPLSIHHENLTWQPSNNSLFNILDFSVFSMVPGREPVFYDTPYIFDSVVSPINGRSLMILSEDDWTGSQRYPDHQQNFGRYNVSHIYYEWSGTASPGPVSSMGWAGVARPIHKMGWVTDDEVKFNSVGFHASKHIWSIAFNSYDNTQADSLSELDTSEAEDVRYALDQLGWSVGQLHTSSNGQSWKFIDPPGEPVEEFYTYPEW